MRQSEWLLYKRRGQGQGLLKSTTSQHMNSVGFFVLFLGVIFGSIFSSGCMASN